MFIRVGVTEYLAKSLMGGAVGTDSTAVAVPLLSEVRQSLVLPYKILVKTLKDVSDLLLLI